MVDQERLDAFATEPLYSINTFVGMVTPFYHPKLLELTGHVTFDELQKYVYRLIPRNWIICNGRTLDGTHPRGLSQSEVDPAFWGRALPNLTERMARGIGASDPEIGHAGGADRFSIPAHSHTVQGMTGSISNGGGDPGRHPYLSRDDNRGWGGFHIRNDGDPNGSEGQHRHDLNTSSSASGAVEIPLIPSYVPLFFIIRIK